MVSVLRDLLFISLEVCRIELEHRLSACSSFASQYALSLP